MRSNLRTASRGALMAAIAALAMLLNSQPAAAETCRDTNVASAQFGETFECTSMLGDLGRGADGRVGTIIAPGAAGGGPVPAACQQWNVAPSFQVQLSNGIAYPMTLSQNGTAFQGAAQFGGAALPVEGSIDGGGNFRLVMTAGDDALTFKGIVGEGGALQNPVVSSKTSPQETSGGFTAAPFVCSGA